MKKKIIFMIINMNVGGTEKALLNMIAGIPKEKYEITILMLERYGGFLNSIPMGVKVEYLKDYDKIKDILNDPPRQTVLNLLKDGSILKAFKIMYAHLFSKLFQDRGIFFQGILRKYKINEKDYDLAVAYAGPMDFISYFVLNKIKARKKVQWIHFDITKIGFNQKYAERTYHKFDKIFVVSKEAKSKLIEKVQVLNKQTEEFYNVVSPETIRSQAKIGKGFEDDYNGLRILTVGRLSHEKGQDIAIRVLARLIANGYNVKWYCIGEGKYRNTLEQLIEDYKLKDHFILLGAMINPYRYIAECEIYVQPSRYEGYCITLIEARCLSKPLVTTEVNGANEQIKNGETGFVVEIDENEVYNSVEALIYNPSLRKKFSENLSIEKIESTKQMEKILKIIG